MILSPPAAGAKIAPYATPSICTLINALAFLALIGGLAIAFLAQDISATVMCFAAAISLLAWAQMIDYIARAAHYTRQTAELLARQPSAPSA